MSIKIKRCFKNMQKNIVVTYGVLGKHCLSLRHSKKKYANKFSH